MINLILVTVFIAATFLSLALFALLRRLLIGNEDEVSQRLAEIAPDNNVSAAEIPLVVRDKKFSQIPALNRWLQRLHVSKNIQRLIDQANLSIKVGQLVLLMLIFGGLGLLLTLKANNGILMTSCIFMFGGLPLAYVLQCRRNRLKLFTQQFPDALDMMTSSLRAGQGFARALQLVATEAPDPLGMEFRKTYEQQNLGLPIKEALMNLTQRINSVDLKLFVTAILIQRESGGNLTEILTKISHTIRARFKLLGQIKVLTAQGRFSSWILGTLPLAIGLIISVLNPDYFMLLLREPLGRLMIVAALTLQIIGFITIRKIVRIKIE